ncbi:MAG: Crp/Fnr family transcriptional regulator [Fidelibacterota bacterium]
MDIRLLKKVPLFSELKDDVLEKIAFLLQRRNYKKNNMILIEEDFGDSLFFINKGKVKVTRISEDGREVILSILSEGDFFGEMSILDGETRSANVISMDESEVFVLKRGDFLNLLERYPKIAISLLQELAMRLRKSDQQIESLSLSDAENRVAQVILRLAADIGKHKLGQVVIEDLPLQQDLANMAGTSRETISRMLKLFSRKEYIRKEGRRLTILNYELFKNKFS